VLETILYGVCLENASYEEADAAFARFESDFFDMNEIRVSSIMELSGVFGDSLILKISRRLREGPQPEVEMARFLTQLYNRNYFFVTGLVWDVLFRTFSTPSRSVSLPSSPPAGRAVRLLLADDHRLFAESLMAVLSRAQPLETRERAGRGGAGGGTDRADR
jgi:hypothetical protein